MRRVSAKVTAQMFLWLAVSRNSGRCWGFAIYKHFTAESMKRHLGLPEDYGVAGFIVYGTYQRFES